MDTIRLIALMIVGTMLGVTLCFFNKIFKKPYLYIRNMFFCAVIGIFAALYLGGTAFKDLPQWITGFSYIIFPTVLGSCSIFLGLLNTKPHEVVSMGLTGPVVFCIIAGFTKLSVLNAMWIGLGTSVFLVLLGLFITKEYFTFECSLCGAYLISALYCDCFYLTNTVFYAIFTALTITGTLLGLFLKKKEN